MQKISNQKRTDAVALLNQGLSYKKIAAKLSISKSTVRNIRKSLAPARQNPRAGRPKLLSSRDEQFIIRKITSGEADTAVEARQSIEECHRIQVSADTVRRTLKNSGLRARAKVKKPYLKPQHIKARLEFANRHKDWTVEDWKRVIWSDETKINRFSSDGRKWCWKSPGKELQPNHVQPTVKFGGGSIMVWGCMTARGPGYMTKIDNGLDAELYCRILGEELQQTIEWYELDRSRLIFQHDNDPKHTAKRTLEWLQEHSIQVLEWPAQSPDLNPIEHLWDVLKRKLATYETPPSGMLELWERVEAEWNKVTEADCMGLIESMPQRVAAVIKAKGGYTKY